MRQALRRKKLNIRSRTDTRRLFGERLESRRVLTAMTDLDLTGFAGNGDMLDVSYEVADQPSAAFDISVYRSSDGTTLDELVLSASVTDSADLAVGTHTRAIPANLPAATGDFQLIAVVDVADQVAEEDESNNQAALANAVFQSSDGDLHVHGTGGADTVEVRQFIDMNMNTVVEVHVGTQWVSFDSASVEEIHVWAHGGDDQVDVFANVAHEARLYGGAGDDDLFGSNLDDILYGGFGDDALTGRGGDDWLFAEDGDDYLSGGDGADVFLGGGGGDNDQNDYSPYDGDQENLPPQILTIIVDHNWDPGTMVYGLIWDDGPPESVTIVITGAINTTFNASEMGDFYLEVASTVEGEFNVTAIDMYGQSSGTYIGEI